MPKKIVHIKELKTLDAKKAHLIKRLAYLEAMIEKNQSNPRMVTFVKEDIKRLKGA